MKRLVITILITVLILPAMAQDDGKVEWLSMTEALKKNKENPRKIFIDVYTDWCGWCKKMDKTTFRDSEVASLLNTHFYPVKFDAEGSKPIKFQGKIFKNPNPNGRRSTHQLAAALLRNQLSYPSYVLLDENNRGLTVLKGYLKEAQLTPILRYIGKDIYKDKKWDEYKKNNGDVSSDD